MRIRRGALALCAAGAALVSAAPARATFPGENGRLAVAWSFGSCGRQIVTMRPDGARRRPLTPCDTVSSVEAPDWSSDGRRLVYERDGSLVVAYADGTHPTTGFDGWAPSFAPDGRRIAHVESDGSRPPTIRVATPTGRSVRTLTRGLEPRWSPDGREIAYRTSRGIFVMAARTGRRLRLIGPGVGAALDWSPDGRWMLYTATSPDFTSELYRIPTDGSGGAIRVTHSDAQVVEGVWSPDGRRIALVTKQLESESVSYEITIVTRRGRRVRTAYASPLRDSESVLPPQLSWRPRP